MKALSRDATPGDRKPGTWNGLICGDGISATVVCPGCGESSTLTEHEIADDGTVSPSLVCPYECGFHDHVRLGGWRE